MGKINSRLKRSEKQYMYVKYVKMIRRKNNYLKDTTKLTEQRVLLILFQ